MRRKQQKVKKRQNPAGTAKAKSGERMVVFAFGDPEAGKVFLAGEFNDWDTQSLPMRKNKQGIWKTKIKLPPGRYEYKFFVDSSWAYDLSSSELVFNPFGTYNSVVSVK